MDRDAVIVTMHECAAELAGSNGRTPGPESDNLLERYGFSSLDALEYLLLLEERLDVSFEDEDLSEAILTSQDRLAEYILQRA